jgi:hypothetical protein
MKEDNQEESKEENKSDKVQEVEFQYKTQQLFGDTSAIFTKFWEIYDSVMTSLQGKLDIKELINPVIFLILGRNLKAVESVEQNDERFSQILGSGNFIDSVKIASHSIVEGSHSAERYSMQIL